MATQGEEKLVWDSPSFAKMYKLAERVTGPFAEDMIKQSGLPSYEHDKAVVLDNACGTGVVMAKLMGGNLISTALCSTLDLTCADFAGAMVNATKDNATAAGWSNVKTVRADAMDTKLPSSSFTHILFNFGPFLLPDPAAGMRECKRMLQPSGTLGLTTWEHVPWIDEYRPVFEQHPEFPPYPAHDELQRLFSTASAPHPWDTAAGVEAHLKTHGFTDIKVQRATHILTLNVDDAVSMTPGTIGMFASKLWTQEQRDTFMIPASTAVEEYLRDKYGDNNFTWEWKGLVGTGRNPE
ncbi:uncharacterized protein HMPREF1541_02719 [Cyphellophora europaea CBS 101466]|uniref:Methyltransferase domain-containing protein n=1 Tax=Cyphellophora europaea (strain CBS 101466) TaxID=1220924 RepID=W2S4N4_CYPE1|nr:uncharacterized protein HMPREF1541_02719 [Cyphellophora europaea CBS 101466]ETN43560.1 hypothetical protein HMPREF1541_02719 [Cyphellophora europaea CBS 101466]